MRQKVLTLSQMLPEQMNVVASSQPWKRNCNPALSPRVLFASFLFCQLPLIITHSLRVSPKVFDLALKSTFIMQ